MSTEEKLELVTRFEDLRAGDLVVGKPCVVCNGGHRGLILDTIEAWTGNPAFEFVPIARCAAARDKKGIFTEGAVLMGCIYRVIIPGADEALDMTVTLPKVKERAR